MNRHVYANVRKFSEIINVRCDVVTICFGHEWGCQSLRCVFNFRFLPTGLSLYCFTCKNIYLFTGQASASFGTDV